MQAEAMVAPINVHTPDLASFTREADIVVTAAGVPGLLTGEMVKPGRWWTSASTGCQTRRLGVRTVGDVNFDPVAQADIAGARRCRADDGGHAAAEHRRRCDIVRVMRRFSRTAAGCLLVA